MATSLAEPDAMVEACASRGIYLAPGDAYRTMPQHWKVKSLIDSGELGEVQSINLYQSREISGGGCQGLSVLRLFAADAEVDWVTGWCSDDAHSDATSEWVATCASPTASTLSFTASARRWRALRCCAARACTTQTGTAASLARGSQRQTGGRRGLFRGVRGYRALDGAQRHASASRNPIDRRLPRQRHRTAVQRRQHAQGAGDRHRPARVASQRVRGGLIPDRDRSLKIVPSKGRFLNKKEVLGEEWYAEQIKASAARPMGGAEGEAR